MNNSEIMLMQLKSDLNIMGEKRNEYLKRLLEAAAAHIETEGIKLLENAEDNNIVVMYAAYLYRARLEGSGGMPQMLRWAMNNRYLKERGG